MRFVASLIALCAACGSAGTAMAEPLAANRPGQANPPSVVGADVLQLEGGINFERQTDGAPNTDTLTLPGVELRYGLTDRVELQLAGDGFVQEWRDDASDKNGLSDIGVAARLLVAGQQDWRPAAAFNIGVSLPLGSDFVTSDGYDPQVEFLYAWDIGERWNLNGNFDWASESQGKDDSSRHTVFRPQLALGRVFNQRVGGFVEYYGVIEEDAPDQHSMDGGLTYLASDDLQFDISAGLGLNDAAPDYFVSAGIAWRVGD